MHRSYKHRPCDFFLKLHSLPSALDRHGKQVRAIHGCCKALQDSRDATSSTAITSALRNLYPTYINLKVNFLSCGSTLEDPFTEADFNIVPAQPVKHHLVHIEDLQDHWEYECQTSDIL
jgi:hypothetical protein